ncbi:MAG: SRPBCC family protein [Thermoleophilia bacterium]|nr:SRPBCC family protein [Thermoleophilia bacterium]
MHTNTHTVEIECPAAAVFPYLAAPECRLQWMGALAASEQVTDGELGVGTRFRDVFEDHGQRIELDAEIVEYEPNRRLATRLSAAQFESTARQELAETGRHTSVTTTIATEYKSRVARIMAGVITRHAQRRLEEDLARLKALVERGAMESGSAGGARTPLA